MLRSLFSGISGLRSHQTMMDVIGNNITNVNTIGYKSNRGLFAPQLSQGLSLGTPPSGESGELNLHGAYFGVAGGSLSIGDQTTNEFSRV